MKDFWRVIKFASRARLLFGISIALTIAITGISLLIPLALKYFFDLIQEILTGASVQSIIQPLVIVTGVYWLLLTIQTVLNSTRDYIQATWWYKTLTSLSVDVFAHLQMLSMDFFDTNSTGKIRERTNQGVNSLINVVDVFFRNISVQLLFTIISMVIVFRINYVYGILTLVGVPLLFFINYKNRRKFTNFRKSSRKLWEKSGAFWQDSLANARIVRAFTKEQSQISTLNRLLLEIKEYGTKANGVFAWLRIYRGFVLDFFRVASISYGVFLISKGEMTLGTFTLVYTYLDRSLNPMQELSQKFEDLQQMLVDTNLLFKFLDEKPSVVDVENATELKKVRGDIELKNVTYSYRTKKVLKGINLKIKSGQTVAFVGKSGVGKTTLMKLLLRYYDVTSGAILVDGHDIRKVGQQSLRRNISTVFQDPYLFNNTIKYNIRYGAPRAKPLAVDEAADLSNADVFIRKLDKGYNTVIGERGVKLSGGEQQRISIARAIIKDAPIIILDEATSSLDSESELLIQDALYNLTQNKTTLIIAHRLSTVMRADLIVVLDKGKISEIGTHKDLVAKKGIYAKLFEIQSGGYLK